jgi:hypothetical protein
VIVWCFWTGLDDKFFRYPDALQINFAFIGKAGYIDDIRRFSVS